MKKHSYLTHPVKEKASFLSKHTLTNLHRLPQTDEVKKVLNTLSFSFKPWDSLNPEATYSQWNRLLMNVQRFTSHRKVRFFVKKTLPLLNLNPKHEEDLKSIEKIYDKLQFLKITGVLNASYTPPKPFQLTNRSYSFLNEFIIEPNDSVRNNNH